MASAGEETQLERLLTVYKRVEEVLYGSVYPLRADTSDETGEIPLGKWESPFVVSKQLGTARDHLRKCASSHTRSCQTYP